MHSYVSQANVDHFLHLLEDVALAPDRRAMVTKLLIEEEDKFGHDLEQLQFAESRAANGRDRVKHLRQKLDGMPEQDQRATAERLLANFEAIQGLLEVFCHHLRAGVQSLGGRPTPVREMSITIGDEIHFGTYFVQGSMVHIQSLFGAKATQLGNSAPEMIAKILLSELVRASGSTD